MTPETHPKPRVAIACGGTGGHLFPGLAVAARLQQRDCRVTLLVSPKEIDQQGVRQATGIDVVVLPAVGLQRGALWAFARGSWRSYGECLKHFWFDPPKALLAMGGFTSAPPLLAARRLRARTFLHESNTIPGRANRWLSWFVDAAFIGFPSAAARLHARRVSITGTPVRSAFFAVTSAEDRSELGLRPDGPVLLVMGGSQGASGINDLAVRALPLVQKAIAGLQVLHLTGRADYDQVRAAYDASGLCAVVVPFFERMDLALGLSTLAVSRSGASSLAEMAAARLPSLLIPFPAATDNHQFHNAQEFVRTGSARMLEQKTASPELFAAVVIELLSHREALARMQEALTRWQQPHAADQIADSILKSIGDTGEPAPANSAAATTPPENRPGDLSRVFAPAETDAGATLGK